MAALTSTVLFTLLNSMNRRKLLPQSRTFCWTRFGTEAGEPIEDILSRKNREREDNDGVFYWGIGNSVAPALRALVAQTEHPEVLFSPMRSKPRSVDVAPSSLAQWIGGETLMGNRFRLPPTVRVTSRASDGARRSHYALVCHSTEPLALNQRGELYVSQLRNLLSGSPIGASQVTAVVRVVEARAAGVSYPVAFRARLVAPYFVRLTVADVGARDLAA